MDLTFFKVSFESSVEITSSGLKKIIGMGVIHHYGSMGGAGANAFKVVFFDAERKVAYLSVPSEFQTELSTSIAMASSFQESPCRLSIERTSPSLFALDEDSRSRFAPDQWRKNYLVAEKNIKSAA